jgi:DNA-binding CsgD family transcriptional regulator
VKRSLGEEGFVREAATGRSLTLDQLLAEAAATLADVNRRSAAPPAPSPAGAIGLSRREREVLALIVAGHSDRDLAVALFISPRTASNHVGNILAKLEVDTRGEAAVRAVRLDLAD